MPTLLDNLVSYWKLDEANGNATDIKGGNTGVNTDVTYSAGKINNGANFNGTSSVLTLNTAIAMPTALTISIWAKNGGTNHVLFADNNAANNTGWYLNLYSGGLEFIWQSGGTARVVRTTNPGMDNNTTIYHIVVTQTGNDAPKFYVNNVEYAATSDNGTAPSKPTAQGSAIGALGSGAGNYFNTLLDEVGYWNRVLNPTEISQLYNNGNGLQYPFNIFIPQITIM